MAGRKPYRSREDDVQEELAKAIHCTRMLKAKWQDLKRGDPLATPIELKDFEEILNILRQLKNPIGIDI